MLVLLGGKKLNLTKTKTKKLMQAVKL